MATPCSFISSLSEAALKKAKIELNEDPNTRDQVILDLRKAIEEKEGNHVYHVINHVICVSQAQKN